MFREKYLEDESHEGFDEEFVKNFLLNGTVHVPPESVLLPSSSVKDLTAKIKTNQTYCFDTHVGPYGWCATCNVI